MFTLHPQLEKDCFTVGSLSLCRVLLMNNAAFPWLILVPERTAMREIIDLPHPDQLLLLDDISHTSQFLKEHFGPDKLNIAALGNQVPQLHIHIIARFKTDSAWPNPVWGKGGTTYDAATKEKMLKLLSALV